MMKYSDMDAASEDMLKEIGNIGTGNAITALSAMVGKLFPLACPRYASSIIRTRPSCWAAPRHWEQASC